MVGVFSSIFGTKKVESKESYSPIIMAGKNLFNNVYEKFLTKNKENGRLFLKLTSDIGETHPYDFKSTIDMYKQYGFVTGIIDKYVDFVVGGGFNISTKDPRTKTILDDFARDFNFETLIRNWLKEALITGNGYLELSCEKDGAIDKIKLIQPYYMYIKEDEFRELKGYTFWKGMRDEKIPLETWQVAHLGINKLSDSPYGIGIIYPAQIYFNKLAKVQHDMQVIIERKSNSPYHIKIGDRAQNIRPSSSDISDLQNKLTTLKNKHEWVTDALVDIDVKEFGDVGNKLIPVIDSYIDFIIFSTQVPEVILGRGKIPEGLAKVQLDTFQRRITSIQEETEKIIENDILKRVLKSNGFHDAEVEFNWGQPSESERQKEITQTIESLKLFNLDESVRKALQDKLVVLMKIEEKTENVELEKKKDNTEPQPRVPGSNRNPAQNQLTKDKPKQPKPNESLTESHKSCHSGHCTCNEKYNSINQDFSLAEWINNEAFNYQDYLGDVIEFIESPEFEDGERATFKYTDATQTEWVENKIRYSLKDSLSVEQVKELRRILIKNFKKGTTINNIRKDILEDVKPDTLEIKIPDLKDEYGKVIRKSYTKKIDPKTRSTWIARVETIRAANEGALKQFTREGVPTVSWVAAYSERTCPYCFSQNGRILPITEAKDRIPAHVACRCSWVPMK